MFNINKLDEMLLIDLMIRTLKAGKNVRKLRGEKYYFETLFLPGYFMHNFSNYSIDDLYSACSRLQSYDFIEFALNYTERNDAIDAINEILEQFLDFLK